MDAKQTIKHILELATDAQNNPNYLTFQQIAEWCEKQMMRFDMESFFEDKQTILKELSDATGETVTVQTRFFVRGRKANGETVWYTGMAGQGFVSDSIRHAFDYPTLEQARNRARNLNQMTQLHGIHFVVPTF